jgi:hypothetical protein
MMDQKQGVMRKSPPEELRQMIISLMREMQKTAQFVNKNSIFGMIQNKTDRDTYEAELIRMLNDGMICTGQDNDHLYVVDE